MSFSNSVSARLLSRLARVVSAHPRWFVFPQILLAALCLFYAARRLELDMNHNHLVSSKLQYQQINLAYQKEFPGENDVLVTVVESDRGDLNRQFIERLAARIRPETNLFADVFYKGDLTTLGPKALLLVPVDNLEQMRQSVEQYLPFIHEFTQATNLNSLFAQVNERFRFAATGRSAANTSMIGSLPFLKSIVVQANQSLEFQGTPPALAGVGMLSPGGKQDEGRIYLTLAEGRIYLLTARAKSEASAPQAIERLRKFIGETQAQVPGVDVGLTGGPTLDDDEMRRAERDSTLASIVALVLCSVIFIVAYREVWRPLNTALCLLVGLGYTLGFTTLAIGHLNILTVTFAPMLIGLAIDFGIHFTTRWEEELRKNRSEAEALHRSMVFTGQGIVTGAFTTAAAFLAMALTGFKGIREMGLISGCGLLLSLVPMLTMLPVLLMRDPRNQLDRQRGFTDARRVRIENLWLQRPVVVVLVTLILCGAASTAIHQVDFDYNLLHMQSQNLSSVVYEKKLMNHSQGSELFGAVMADSLSQARDYEEKLKMLPAVANVQSAADFLVGDQDRKLELIREMKDKLAPIRFVPPDPTVVNIEPLSATLWYLTGYLGAARDAAQQHDPELANQMRSLDAAIGRLRLAMFRKEPEIPQQLTEFQQAFFQNLRATLNAIQLQDTSGPLRPEDLPPALRDRFIGVTGKYLLQVFPRKDLWQHDNQREFIQQLQSVVPPDRVTGTPVGLYEYTTLLKNSYEQAALYAVGAIVVMVLLHFRSLLCLVLALAPVAIGCVWLLGFMGSTGVPFNPADIMTLPLVVGIGVTNGIQILNRFAEEQRPGILARSTGKAVLVSGLTGIAGFGSLILAQHRGIRSLGIVMSVALTACLFAALSFLPAVLSILWKRGWRIRLAPERSS